MPLINCDISLILTWSENYVISSASGKTKFAIRDTKFYVPIVTYQLKIMQNCLNNYDLASKKQLTEIKINQNFQRKEKKQYLHFLIEPSFQGVNRVFVSLFENDGD